MIACYICGKRFLKFANDKNYRKVGDRCYFPGKYRAAAQIICNLRFNVANEIPLVFDNGSNYDYHFIIKEIANEFEGQFECLRENTENCKTLSVCSDRKGKRKVDKDGNEDIITISYKIKFIDSVNFMASSLSDLVDKHAEEIPKINCKDCDHFFEYESVKGNLIKYKCLFYNQNYSNKID